MRYLKTIAVTAVAVAALTGCASKDSKQLVAQYALTSASVQKRVLESYDMALESHHDAKIMFAVRDGASVNDLLPETFEYSGQRQTLRALVAFSDALAGLTSDEAYEEIDRYTLKLAGSLKKLSENEQLPQQYKVDTGLIATVANGMARAYMDHARYKALKKILKESRLTVSQSIALLRGDLPAWENVAKVSLRDRLNVMMGLLNQPNRCSQKAEENGRCVTYAFTPQERFEAFDRAAALKMRLDSLGQEFDALDRALASLAKLHLSVVDAIEADDDRSIDALKKDVATIQEMADAIKQFQSALKD